MPSSYTLLARSPSRHQPSGRPDGRNVVRQAASQIVALGAYAALSPAYRTR
jgi:hypothetical protein